MSNILLNKNSSLRIYIFKIHIIVLGDFMIIFYKKRILFINLIIFLSILFCSINMSQNCKSISTSSLPAANHTIILDAGHGYPDGGAVSADGTLESELNLKIVEKLQNLLESSNCTVILTRSDENGIYESNANSIREKKISDMKNRVMIANDSNADIFVSIHMNKIPQTQYSGYQSFYKNKDEKSKNLANNIQKNLNYFIDKNNNREIQSISNIYITKKVEIPLAIIECGFLSNINEASKLKDENYQDLLAWSIYTGILDYFD